MQDEMEEKLDKYRNIIVLMVVIYFFTVLECLGAISRLEMEVDKYKEELSIIREGSSELPTSDREQKE